MVKNVKIEQETHRRLSIKASELVTKKSDLCSALINAALDTLTAEQIRDYLSRVTTTDHPDDD